ncbi:hypothetical protein AMJ50_00450 [Parcubacteria bacterium DG_74_3]|nr:MAG: hypothetical protein AMJ50_00450 [Parcubacteria bacterium DG_74_3]
MKFNYQARTQEGQIQTGVVEASTREVAIALLQNQGLFVTLLEEEAYAPVYARRITFGGKISRKDVVLFSRQLSIMFKSKIPLVETLRILAAQTQTYVFKEKIIEISEEIEGGTSFSVALSRYPKIFSSFYIAMVRAGEASGKLSEALGYLAEHLERDYHLKNKLRGAMVYPALIFFFVLMVLILMIFFVFPRFVEVLEETGAELPVVTLMILGLADSLKKWGVFLIVITVGLIIFIVRYYQTPGGKKFFDGAFLKIPVINNFLKMLYLSRFAENLSTLISGGLPIAQALEIASDIVGNAVYEEIILDARDGVRRGEPISYRLSQSPEVFPPLFYQMTLVGEKTGTLDKTLISVVDFYNQETDRAIDGLLSIVEPVLIMFLGLIVGGLMISVLMPLYRLTTF